MWALGILVFGLVVVAIFQRLIRPDGKLSDAAQGAQAVISLIAILFAGYWFIYERKAYPQADVEQEVEVRKIANDLVLITATISVTNDGHTVLDIRMLNSRLLQIEPLTLPLRRHQEWGRDDWPASMTARAGDPRTLVPRENAIPIYDKGQLRFEPLRGLFLNAPAGDDSANGLMQIEPGETDRRVVDFVTDCRLRTGRVVTEVRKPGTKNLAWKMFSTVSLREACAENAETKRGKNL